MGGYRCARPENDSHTTPIDLKTTCTEQEKPTD
jgi:hypothetical protein